MWTMFVGCMPEKMRFFKFINLCELCLPATPEQIRLAMAGGPARIVFQSGQAGKFYKVK
jgi:hypothetical protein